MVEKSPINYGDCWAFVGEMDPFYLIEREPQQRKKTTDQAISSPEAHWIEMLWYTSTVLLKCWLSRLEAPLWDDPVISRHIPRFRPTTRPLRASPWLPSLWYPGTFREDWDQPDLPVLNSLTALKHQAGTYNENSWTTCFPTNIELAFLVYSQAISMFFCYLFAFWY